MMFNPYLAGGTGDPADPRKGGPDAIEHPHKVANIPWQTRAAPLTAFEDALATALQEGFNAGVDDLPGLVAALNRSPVKHPDGTWTEANYQTLMAKLAHGDAA